MTSVLNEKLDRPWESFLDEARDRVLESKLRFNDPLGLIRMEDEEEDEGSADPNKPDLSAPEIQDAIRKAVSAADERFRKETEGLKKNRDEILAEKKRWQALGDPEELSERLKKAEELERKLSAEKAGMDPEKFNNEVERVAAEKDKVRQQEFRGVLDSKDGKIKELETQVEELHRKSHRSFVAKELVLAALPEGTELVQHGAWDHLIDSISPYVVEHQPDGLPYPVGRLRVNESLVPGGGPDNLMTMRELLPQIRMGKGPLPVNLGYCFVSNGKGSGTTQPSSRVSAGESGNWWKMSAEDQDAYIRDKGKEAAMDLIDRSERPAN